MNPRQTRRRRQTWPAPQRRDADIAWAAGYCDGEAVLRLEGGSAVLRVGNTHRPSLHRLQAMFRGSVVPIKAGTKDPNTHRPMYCWTVCGADAREALRTMLPYLNEKAAQAEVILAVKLAAPGGRLTDADMEQRAQQRRELSRLKRVRH